jgi:hypothetical protein
MTHRHMAPSQIIDLRDNATWRTSANYRSKRYTNDNNSLRDYVVYIFKYYARIVDRVLWVSSLPARSLHSARHAPRSVDGGRSPLDSRRPRAPYSREGRGRKCTTLTLSRNPNILPLTMS